MNSNYIYYKKIKKVKTLFPFIHSLKYNGGMDFEKHILAARAELSKRVIGQHTLINGLLMGFVSGGHILIEGMPGLAKTLAVKSLAEITNLEFKRIQFTPDLLPADVTGTLIWEQANSTFAMRKGPVFANIILADEINRAPAKVQSSLLEAMEEQQVTVGNHSYPLPSPFFVLATQNPIDNEGTYPLPEAQLDRFLLKLVVKYPEPDEELLVVKLAAPFPQDAAANPLQQALEPVLNEEVLKQLRLDAALVHIDEQIEKYIVNIVRVTRPDSSKANKDGLFRYIAAGASPRASIAMHRCARINALFEGRDFVLPEDVKAVALSVLRHRLILSYEAEADNIDNDTIISRILSFVPVP
ncbi:ATPase AAA [Spirochaetia bacterium]|nr:ATPase AAA [Spirochaetia bacterium]